MLPRLDYKAPQNTFDYDEDDPDRMVICGQPFTGMLYSYGRKERMFSDESYSDGYFNGYKREWFMSGQIAAEVLGQCFYGYSCRWWYESGVFGGVAMYERRIMVSSITYDEQGRWIRRYSIDYDPRMLKELESYRTRWPDSRRPPLMDVNWTQSLRHLGWTVSSGLSAEVVTRAETALGVALPEDYRQYLQFTNGAQFRRYKSTVEFYPLESNDPQTVSVLSRNRPAAGLTGNPPLLLIGRNDDCEFGYRLESLRLRQPSLAIHRGPDVSRTVQACVAIPSGSDQKRNRQQEDWPHIAQSISDYVIDLSALGHDDDYLPRWVRENKAMIAVSNLPKPPLWKRVLKRVLLGPEPPGIESRDRDRKFRH